jgi:4-hydroxybenzoate polyprenyltransferase
MHECSACPCRDIPFFRGKIFISSTLFDFKDVRGDCEAGIFTLPVCLGEALTKKVLLGTSFLLYGIMAILHHCGIPPPRDRHTGLQFLFTVVFIGLYSLAFEERATGIKKHFRQIMVAGEMPVAILSR